MSTITKIQAYPIGSGPNADKRFKPKTVTIPLKTGDAEDDPNAAANADAVNAAENPPGVPVAGQGGNALQQVPVAGTNPGTLFLGIGASATAQGFGGPGVGTGSGFPGFTDKTKAGGIYLGKLGR